MKPKQAKEQTLLMIAINALETLHDIIEYDCTCIDPAEDYDDPISHSQYCPIYLLHYIENTLLSLGANKEI